MQSGSISFAVAFKSTSLINRRALKASSFFLPYVLNAAEASRAWVLLCGSIAAFHLSIATLRASSVSMRARSRTNSAIASPKSPTAISANPPFSPPSGPPHLPARFLILIHCVKCGAAGRPGDFLRLIARRAGEILAVY